MTRRPEKIHHSSLKLRIIRSTIITVAASFLIIISVIFTALFNSLQDAAKAESLTLGQKYATIFENKLNNAVNYLSVAVSVLESQIDSDTVDRIKLRETFYNIFDDYAPLIDGTSIMFEYNMYDGRDAEYVNSEYGTIASGRICWYFYQENGKTVYLPQADVSDTTDSEFDGAYYVDAKTSGKPIYTEPFVYEVDGKDVPMFTLSHPIKNSGGEFLGVVTVDLFLDDLYAQLQSEQIHKTGYMVVTNDKDQVIYSPIYEDVSKSRRESNVDYVLSAANETTAYSYARSLINGRNSLVTSISVHIPRIGSDFYIAVVAPTLEIYEGGIILVAVLALFSIIFIVGIGVILYSNINKSIKPLITLADISNKVADGDFQFTLPQTANDEIGTLAKNFEAMSFVIHNLTDDINGLLAELKTHRNINLSIDISKYKGVYAEVVNRISEMALSFNRILTEINQVSSEVAEEAHKIASSANNANILTNKSKDAAFKGNDNMRSMLDAMEAIKASSLNVGNVIQVIEEISRQTNILALNASVEAAHAGTQGMGFGVVAEEVRNLANKIQNSIDETRKLIDDTVSKVATGSSIALITDSSLKEIIESITQISELVDTIAEASGEQSNSAKSLEKLSE